ncbi:hypothetical protein C9J03_10270 [Photobacterium gaetbulicola]|uniref:Lipoprotein n=1 Tax=Photobacterium gaetbulicola Gung47 TaxID=658445 RepID=A0A0C5WRU0_9GAMM|nr:hypothetical protein [Photobacterium gaetbulicola]AJR09888.1 hypothetical protein H744_2c3246 [Photobacterium gaetbulicola Gung47]PSU12410.1 hypothetical protein C9J03_10270 [Photobacterium gaetbulicola]
MMGTDAKALLLAAGMVLVAGCGERAQDQEAPSQDPAVAEELAVQEAAPVEDVPVTLPAEIDIWQSPQELVLSDVAVYLGSELWLNSMPVIGDDGSQPADKLHASIRLLTRDMKPLPQGVEILQVMVAQGDQQWLGQENLDVRSEGEMSLEVSLRGGPEWPAGSKADIAVTVLYQGQELIVVQRDVLISQVF